MPKTILVTGAAGFIGRVFIQKLLEETDYNIIVVDCLTYAARVENGSSLSLKMVVDLLREKQGSAIDKRYTFIDSDIRSPHIKIL